MFTRLYQKTILVVLGIALMPVLTAAISPPSEDLGSMSIFNRIYQQSIAEITITTDLDSVMLNRNEDKYIPATFSMKEGKNDLKFDMKVKARGKFRRRLCDFPPLKLKFSKKDLNAAGLSSFNKLKLVTHCLDDKEISRELVMREFLSYELYQELNENSYKVKLAKLTYIDKKSGKKTRRWGFIIEPTDELAYRLNGEEVELMGQSPDNFNTTSEKILSTFQYMIGNEDWSLDMNRNIKLIKDNNTGKLTPVPYDFDFSGLVNAPYALPKSDFQMTNIRERIYLGHAQNNDELYSTFSYFRTKRDDLIKKVYKFSHLSEPSKVDIVNYIKSFYELIEVENTAGIVNTQNTTIGSQNTGR
jgi:hypothetical protein